MGTRGDGPGSFSQSWAADAARRALDARGGLDFRALPELLSTPCPTSLFLSPVGLGKPKELHAVGVREGVLAVGGSKEAGLVRVAVRAVGRPIALVLMSRSKVVWHVDPDVGAEVSGIVVCGPPGCLVRFEGPVARIVPFANGPRVFDFEADGTDDVGPLDFIRQLGEMGAGPVGSFQGEPRGERFVVPPYRHHEPIGLVWNEYLKIVAELSTTPSEPFWLVDRGYASRSGTREEPTPVPDPETKGVAFCEADGRLYAITDSALYAIHPERGVEQIGVPDVETRGPFGGVAYDEGRRIVLLASSSAHGVHYLFDPIAQTFEAVPAERTGGGLHGLAHHRGRDVVFALRGGHVITLSPTLEPLSVLEHGPLPMCDPDVRPTAVQISALSSQLTVCLWDEKGARGARERNPDHVRLVETGFVLGLDGGEVRFLMLDRSTPRPSEEGERRIWVADLQRDPGSILDEVAETKLPILIESRAQPSVVLLSYEVYQGYQATLEEIAIPGWRDRLAQASRELGACIRAPEPKAIATMRDLGTSQPAAWPKGPVVWTPQAAEFIERRAKENFGVLGPMFAATFEQALSYTFPLAGPFQELDLRASHSTFRERIVLRLLGDEIWIAWIRDATRRSRVPDA